MNNQQVNRVVQQQPSSGIGYVKGMDPELYRAALCGSFEVISCISNWKQRATPTGNNVLHVHVGKPRTSKEAEKIIKIEFIEEVLGDDGGSISGYELMWKENDKGDTPLHLAARFGHKNVVRVFLERANQVNQPEMMRMLKILNKKKDTALHDAARAGHVDLVKLLVEADDHNCPHDPNEMGETPLYLAAERGSAPSVAIILDTCHLSSLAYPKGPCGRTALHAAVQWGNTEMVQKLMEHDSTLIWARDDEGLTPLHCVASERGKSQLLKVLLEYDRSNRNNNESSAVYIQDNKGRTALHIAIIQGNWDAMDNLIAFCPDCIEIMDNNGQNVVHYAAKFSCVPRFKAFLDLGHFDNLINENDVHGNTPLHILAASILNAPHHWCVRKASSFVKNNPLLDVKMFNRKNLTFGDIIVSNKKAFNREWPIEERSFKRKGMEPKLYNAALNGSIEDVRSIPNWMEQATPTGNTILHIHLGKPLYNMVSKDRRKNVSIEFIEQVLNDQQGTTSGYFLVWKKNNNNGDTPVHLAARFGYYNVVKLFLERAKEVHQEEVTQMLRMANHNKDTALHEAARGSHAAIVKLLLETHSSSCLYEANEVGETPLYLAAERGCTESVATILETCHPSSLLGYGQKGPCGRTPLHAAVHWGNPDMVQKILEKETSLIRVQDYEGLTPLHSAAAENNKYQLLKVLLEYDNKETETSALYIQDNKGRTPLHIAILRCNWEAIKKFTKCRPDCIEIVDNHRRNVVHYAAKWGCLYKLKTCLKKGHFDNLLNDKDVDGNTPLHLFATSIPNLGHACLLMLPCFIRSNYPFIDLQSFNNHNLTIGDIFASKFHMLHPGRSNIQRLRSLITPKGKRVNAYEEEVDIEKANSNAYSKLESLRKAAQGQSLVATLIATVSFTAGFTLPGGFNQNPGRNIGMAVLKNNAAFKIFLISDALAFTCSTLAILMYFILVTTESTFIFEPLSHSALILNTISLGALMLAFTTGVSVVVSHSPHLVFAIWAIATVFFFYYGVLIFRNVRAGLHHARRCLARNHQNF